MKISEDTWNRWIDGELSPTEQTAMERAVAENPDLAHERALQDRLSEDLRLVVPSEVTPPYPDFFNNHIQKRIRDINAAKRSSGGAWPSWLRLPWLIPVAATAALAIAAVQLGWLRSAKPGSQIVHSYLPDPGLTAQVVYHSEATVLKLAGLAPLPEDFDLRLAKHEPPAPGPRLVGRKTPAPKSGSSEEVHFISHQPTP